MTSRPLQTCCSAVRGRSPSLGQRAPSSPRRSSPSSGCDRMIRVAVVGAAGRMGSAVCAAVDEDPDVELVARVNASDSLDAVLDAGADVAVEFTVPDSVKRNTAWLLTHGVHTV